MSDEARPPDNEAAALRARVRRALDSVYRPAPGLRRRAADAVAGDRRRGARLPASLAWVAVPLAVAAAVVVALVQHSERQGGRGPIASPTPTVPAEQVVYALTAANQVLALDASTLAVRWHTEVAGVPSSAILPGSMMALSPDRSTLYVLPPADSAGGRMVVMLDAARGRLMGTVALGGGGAAYRTLAVDPQSGNLYVVGQEGGDLVVTVVDPQREVVLGTQVTRALPPTGPLGGGIPYEAAFTTDGSRLYYSYKGPDAKATGIDWVDVAGQRLTPCRSSAGSACLPGPGTGFAVTAGGHLLAGEGSPSPLVVERDRSGTVLRRSASGLAGLVWDLVVDVSRAQVLVIGECPSQGGLSSLDLGSGQLDAISTPAPAGAPVPDTTPCGRRPVLVARNALAVSQLQSGRASPQSPGTVSVIDTATGQRLRTTTVAADVDDLLAGR